MNKDQIMRAMESASPEQLEQIAAIVGTNPAQVPVTKRHVGCVVELSDNRIAEVLRSKLPVFLRTTK